jgi:hypothetical protein
LTSGCLLLVFLAAVLLNDCFLAMPLLLGPR